MGQQVDSCTPLVFRHSTILTCLFSAAMPDPQRQRGGGRSISNRGRTQNRFFFGQAGNAGLAGAALGAAAQYFTNQVFNPCTRSNTRKVSLSSCSSSSCITIIFQTNTNNRFFTGNPTIDNGALGFVAGFAGSALVNNALGNPCGK